MAWWKDQVVQSLPPILESEKYANFLHLLNLSKPSYVKLNVFYTGSNAENCFLGSGLGIVGDEVL